MTLFHGNKNYTAIAVVCFVTLSLVMGSLVAERKAVLSLHEKEYESVVAENEKANQLVLSQN